MIRYFFFILFLVGVMTLFHFARYGNPFLLESVVSILIVLMGKLKENYD